MCGSVVATAASMCGEIHSHEIYTGMLPHEAVFGPMSFASNASRFAALAERRSALLHWFMSARTLVSCPLFCSLAHLLLYLLLHLELGLATVPDLAFLCGLHPSAGHFVDLSATFLGPRGHT